ncbi:MAG: hypothetical protein ACTS27_11740 [Phycisphaerales bacterium]
MTRAPLRTLLRAAVALCAPFLLAPPALACGGTGGGVQGPAPNPPCIASTAIFKQHQRSIIGPYTGLTIPIWFSAQIQTSNCAPVARVEFTASLRSQATGQLVATGSTTLNGPPVGTTFGVTVGALRLVQPSIPTGIYIVQGSARVVLTNGQAFSNGGDSCLAIVDPSPNDPSLPRLDVELLTFPSAPTAAGDNMLNTYRLTNNDPVHSYTGDFIVRNRSSAGQPTIESLGDPGSEPFFVYSIAAPVQGDNFPLAFSTDLPPGVCLPLPPNPADPAIPEIVSSVALAPGESIEVTVVSRGWGMCSGGSGCEQVAVLEGFFSDGTQLDACAGGAAIIDDSVPPAFACDDGESGAVAPVLPIPPGADRMTWLAHPVPGNEFLLDAIAPPQLPMLFCDQPLPAQLRVVPVSEFWTRFEYTAQLPPQLPCPEPVVQWSVPITLTPNPDGPPVLFSDADFMPFPGEPFGFENFFPFGKGMLAIDKLATPEPVDSFFDIYVQIEGAAFDSPCSKSPPQSPESIPVQIVGLDLVSVSPTQVNLQAQVVGFLPDCDLAPPRFVTLGLNLRRGFARGIPPLPECPGDTNGDNIVNFADLNAVVSDFGSIGTDLPGDVNGDGIVNFEDLNIVLSNFGTVCAS